MASSHADGARAYDRRVQHRIAGSAADGAIQREQTILTFGYQKERYIFTTSR